MQNSTSSINLMKKSVNLVTRRKGRSANILTRLRWRVIKRGELHLVVLDFRRRQWFGFPGCRQWIATDCLRRVTVLESCLIQFVSDLRCLPLVIVQRTPRSRLLLARGGLTWVVMEEATPYFTYISDAAIDAAREWTSSSEWRVSSRTIYRCMCIDIGADVFVLLPFPNG